MIVAIFSATLGKLFETKTENDLATKKLFPHLNAVTRAVSLHIEQKVSFNKLRLSICLQLTS
jgi:uncharacterized membrane protein required for colicin V production